LLLKLTVITVGFAPLPDAVVVANAAPVYKLPRFNIVVSVNKLCPLAVPTIPLAKYLKVVVLGIS
jgi:uncharacterized protein YpmS